MCLSNVKLYHLNSNGFVPVQITVANHCTNPSNYQYAHVWMVHRKIIVAGERWPDCAIVECLVSKIGYVGDIVIV